MSVYRTPEPAPKLPRAIRLKASVNHSGLWLVRIFILPHSFVGVLLICGALISLATSLVGEMSPGQVTSSHVSHSKSSYTYNVDFSYAYGGHLLTGSRPFSLGSRPTPAAHERFDVGHSITVRHLGVGAWRNSRMMLPGEANFDTASFGAGAFLALFWNSVLAFFWYRLWYLPWRNRKLFLSGSIAPGRIEQKIRKQGRGTILSVEYSYSPQGQPTMRGSMTVNSQAVWDQVAEGQAVQVLYSPEHPARSVVYECGDHEWAEG